LSIDYNNDKKNNNKRSENIFEIMDGIIDQLNNTKRLFIAMILTVMIIPPAVFVITFELLASSNPPSPSPPPPLPTPPPPPHIDTGHHKGGYRGGGPLGSNLLSTITKGVPLIIGILWLGIGIRQWIVLSKWSRKYQKYKELQKKIDEKIDDEEDSVNNN
jgi:hypothetical protein